MMVVIYSQNETYIKQDVEEAYNLLHELYGAKLGEEAYQKLKDAPVGFSFRKNGGPLVKLVSKQEANAIKSKEQAIGMLKE